MVRERWFRGGHEARERPFDWYGLAKERDIPVEQARALYEEALHRARGYQGSRRNAEAIFRGLLEEVRQETWRPSPGKITRTMLLAAERTGKRRRKGPLAPGKRALTSYLEPSARERRPSSQGQNEATRAEHPPSGEARFEPVTRERLVPGTMMYRDYQANLAAAHGHREQLQALEEEEHRAAVADVSPPRDGEASAARAQPSPSGRSGQPLPPAVRAKMEHAFGVDFSAVRIHEDQQASAVGALAYTQHLDIHVALGQYDPNSQRGQALLGHELAHVVQQGQGRVHATGQVKGMLLNDDPALERQADEMGARAARGERLAASTGWSAEMGGHLRPAPEPFGRAPIQRQRRTDDAQEDAQEDEQPGQRRVFVIGSPSPDEIRANHPYQFVDAARYQGVNENTVWIVERTGYEQGNVALDRIESLISQGQLIWITPENDLVSVLNEFTEHSIRSFRVFSHGIAGQVALRYGWADQGLPNYGLDVDRIAAMRPDLFDDEADVRFDSCNAGTDSPEGNLAQRFATQSGADVEAWTGRTSFAEVNDGAADGRTEVEGSQILRGRHLDYPEMGSQWILGRTPEVRTFSPPRGEQIEERSSYFEIHRRLPETSSFEVPADGTVVVSCSNIHLVTNNEDEEEALARHSTYTANGTAMEPEEEYQRRMAAIQGRIRMILHRDEWGRDANLGGRFFDVVPDSAQRVWSHLAEGTYYLEIYRIGGHSYPVHGDIVIEVYGERQETTE